MHRILIAVFALAVTAGATTITVTASGDAQGPFALDSNGASVSFGAFTQNIDVTFDAQAMATFIADVPMSLTFSSAFPDSIAKGQLEIMLTIDGLPFTVGYTSSVASTVPGVGPTVLVNFYRCCGVPAQYDGVLNANVIPSATSVGTLSGSPGDTVAGVFPVYFVASEIPEPASYSLIGAALLLLTALVRLRKRARQSLM